MAFVPGDPLQAAALAPSEAGQDSELLSETPPMCAPKTGRFKNNRGRAPPLRRRPFSVSTRTAPARRSLGTRRALLTVASFRPWRGSQTSVATDPAFNTTLWGQRPKGLASEEDFNPATADCGYRAPLAPRLARPHIQWYGSADALSIRGSPATCRGRACLALRGRASIATTPCPLPAEDGKIAALRRPG